MKSSWHVAYGGVLVAVSVVILLLASAIPSMGWCFCAAAGLPPAFAFAHRKVRAGVLVYIGTLVLAFLIVPEKGFAIAYATLFGPYPMLKYAIEQAQNIFVEWTCKLLYVSALGFGVAWLIKKGMIPWHATDLPDLLLIAGLLLMFICYDIIFSKIIAQLLILFDKDKYNKS